MFLKSFVLTLLLVGVNCRYLVLEERPLHLTEDGVIVAGPEIQQLMPAYSRVRRQASTTLSLDGATGNAELSAKIPVARSDNAMLSVTGSQSDAARGLGLVLENSKGHALSLSQKSIPDFGNQMTAAGKLNLLHTDKHNVDATAFATKNIPKFPDVPNFNTYGGNVDYTYNNKIGASLGAARTDFLQRTDVNALGHLNLFRNKDSSLDFNAGASRSFSPFIPKSSWEPNFGLSFTKYW